MLFGPIAFVLLLTTHADASVGVGVSSNPLELPSPAPTAGTTAPEPGTFIPIHAMGDTRIERGDFRAGVRGWIDADAYAWIAQDPAATSPSRASDANRGTAYAGAPLAWLPWTGDVKLTLGLEPFAGLHREIFTSPVTGRPYTAGGIDYSRRFDTNRAGARASAELELGNGTDAWGALSWQRVDYVEDYLGVPSVDRWDYNEFRADVDAYYYPRQSEIAVAYSFRRRDYDARFPHDSSGTQILPGTAGYAPQIFDFHELSITGGFVREDAHALARIDVERRLDENGGYLDYWDSAFTIDVRVEDGEWTLRATPNFSMRFYDIARTNYDPTQPTNFHWRLDVPLTAERHVSETLSVWIEAGWTDQWSTNTLYTWRAAHAATGVRVRFR